MSVFTRELIKAKQASSAIQRLSLKKRNAILSDLRRALILSATSILAANKRDFSRLPSGYSHADRLKLTKERILGIADGLKAVQKLPDPLNRRIDRRTLKNGLTIERRTVPLGVIGIIYEARPNVTVEIFSLAIKSGNVVVLKGGSEAYESNKVFTRIIHSVLKKHGVPTHTVTLLDPFKKSLVKELLRANKYVDLIIPRGSDRLIKYVRENSTLPTIETGAGVCHIYVERSANLAWAARIVFNAKTRRVSVCNALDTLVVDESIASKLFSKLAPLLVSSKVEIFADLKSFNILNKKYPKQLLHRAKPSDYGKEFLGLAISIKTVKDWCEGFEHIKKYTSKHSEGIITSNKKLASLFQDEIDAAVVYVNTSIGFTDGYEFGLGGEIGISTQKLHARGPMALNELTTYKWYIKSQGAIRPV